MDIADSYFTMIMECHFVANALAAPIQSYGWQIQ